MNYTALVQKPGTSISLRYVGLLASNPNIGTIYTWAPFPFMTKNTNYTISFTSFAIDGIGTFTTGIDGDKYKNGILCHINNSATGTRYVFALDFTITFA